MQLTSEFYEKFVPKEREANLLYRRQMLEQAQADPAFANELRTICARDCLYYINFAAWLIEPRATDASKRLIPFITREYQDEAILTLQRNLGLKDTAIYKSRDVGATWMVLYVYDWFWRFMPYSLLGVVSKDLETADSPQGERSLFSKLDFINENLPWFLTARDDVDRFRHLSKHTIRNLKNGSCFTAYPATANALTSDRVLCVLFDEFHFFGSGDDYAVLGSAQHTTNSRFFVSTPNPDRGEGGAFYDIVTSGKYDAEIIRIRWRDDPQKAKGLYSSTLPLHVGEDATLQILDTEFWSVFRREDGTHADPADTNQDYEFVLDGRTRSPYYDHECRRAGNKMRSIAAELDLEFAGATEQLWERVAIDKAKATVEPPACVIEWNESATGFYSDFQPKLNSASTGAMKLWSPEKWLDGKKVKPQFQFTCGVDVAAGTGGDYSSYSSIEVWCKNTGEQVAEWLSNTVGPHDLADLSIAVCTWFNNAYLCPEVNGPIGGVYAKRLIDSGYGNVHLRDSGPDKSVNKRTMTVGVWNSDRGTKILKELAHAVSTGSAVLRSERVLHEVQQYFLGTDGKATHAGERSAETLGEKGLAHGDAAIACACGWMGVTDWPVPKEKPEEQKAAYGSFLWRRQQYLKKEREKNRYWSPFGETG